MVGDSLEDDVEGARACGMRAIHLDRASQRRGEEDRIGSLAELPSALGLRRGS